MTTPPPLICLPSFPAEEIHLLIEPGQTVLHPASGLFVHVGLDGELSVTLPPITAVRIADAAELQASHEVQAGSVELSGERMCVTFNGSTGIVSVSAGCPPASESSPDSPAPE
jgi:hypothetical protein